MTACLGWTGDDAVYLVADSAVTSANPLQTYRTTFGELHYSNEQRSVEESAIKIFRHRATAATFTGNSEIARSVFNTYIKLTSNFSPLDAFRAAWGSHGPYTDQHKIVALFGFYKHSPRLIRFCNEESNEGKYVHFELIGNTTIHGEYNLRILRDFIEDKDTIIDTKLQFVMSYMQSFSVFQNTLPSGVGGFYIGATISRRGFQWFKPTIYAMSTDALTSSLDLSETPNVVVMLVKNDALFTLNGLSHGWNVYLNKTGCYASDSDNNITISIKKLLRTINIKNIPFQYLTIYNLRNNAITIFRTNGSQKMPAIHPRFVRSDGKTNLLLSISDEARAALERDPAQTSYIVFFDFHEKQVST